MSRSLDTLQKTQAFFEKMQPAAAHARGAHVCGLSGVFSDAPVAGKNEFDCRLRAAMLCCELFTRAGNASFFA